MPGLLYIVATPIGNLDDTTFRAVQVLNEAGLIACEDTRRTQKLLAHFEIKKPLARYDEHSHASSSRNIIDALKRGLSVALVTDAGTPALSDPGSRLVAAVLEAGLSVIPIPGASSITAALSASGFPSDQFQFLGFLPRKEGRAKRELREALGLGKTTAFFESPFRVQKTLQWLSDIAPQAPLAVFRELTKMHEEHIRGTVEQVRKRLENQSLLGEFVLVIGPTERLDPGPENDDRT